MVVARKPPPSQIEQRLFRAAAIVGLGPVWPEVVSAYEKPAEGTAQPVHRFNQKSEYRLQSIRGKQEGQKQEDEPAVRGGRKEKPDTQ